MIQKLLLMAAVLIGTAGGVVASDSEISYPEYSETQDVGNNVEISLYAADMTPEERQIVKAGCLINFMKK